GGLDQARERCREAHGWPGLSSWVQDADYGLRRLRHAPGFTLAVIAILALGIGATTAMFSLFNSLLLRPLPVRDPQHLALLRWHAPAFPRFSEGFSMPAACTVEQSSAGVGSCSFSYPMYRQLQQANIFTALAGFTGSDAFTFSGSGAARMVTARYVTGNYFEVLGVRPGLGRLLEPSDDQPDAAPAVVVSHSFWREQLGAADSVEGSTVRINGIRCTIVGVAAGGFNSLVPGERDEVWMPLSLRRRVMSRDWNPSLNSDGFAFLILVGRLRPDASSTSATAAATVIWNRWLHQGPRPALAASVGPGRVTMATAQLGLAGSRTRYGDTLELLLLGTGLLLAIACANVAGLVLARSGGRRREMALRRALGAGRVRVFRQLMIEVMVLALIGGLAGLALAVWGSHALLAFMQTQAAAAAGLTVTLDWRVLGANAVCALGSGVVLGLVPALRGARQPLAPALQTEAGATRPRLRLASLLVIAQVGFSMVLVAGAGLLTLTLRNLEKTSPGFNVRGLLTFGVHPSQLGYQRAALPRLYSQLATRLAAVPGVTAVGYSSSPLVSPALADGYSERIVRAADGRQILPKELSVGPGYLETLGVPLLAGRYLEPGDLATGKALPTPVLINQIFAQAWFGASSPLGQILRNQPADPGLRVVGVVGNTLFESQRAGPSPEIFLPGFGNAGYFTLRSSVPGSVLAAAVRKAVAAVDSLLPVYDLSTQAQNQAQLLYQERLLAWLGDLIGGLALLLSAIGLYGLLAFEVAQRRRELEIRLVLGARPAQLVRSIARRALLLTAAGLALGTLAAWAGLAALTHWLYQVQPMDPAPIAVAWLLLFAAAAMACWLPARRALASNPAEVLRGA
ncbi:MAG: ADOP family duplicated permease, partial [Terriglobales bacterium]